MEDRGFLVVGTNWKWEVPICMGNVSRSIPEAIKHEVVVQLRGPGYCYYRRFSPIEGDALQFYIKPIRPVSPDVRNEGRSSQCLLKKIIVTCPFSPDQLLGNLEWVGVEQGLQLKRRIDHVIQFPQLAMMYARESY